MLHVSDGTLQAQTFSLWGPWVIGTVDRGQLPKKSLNPKALKPYKPLSPKSLYPNQS